MSFIETERLLIRKWDLARDVDDALEIYGDLQTMRFIPCGALNREQTERLLTRFVERDDRDGFGIWPVVLKSERRVIGECGITYIPCHENDIEIAWIFNRAYYGKGYATEAARAVKEYAFAQAGVAQLYALIDRANAASIAVANRLGMDFDRVIRAYRRDLMRYRALPRPQ
jgi:[ribosomal protein S5]-alanine N-acetyltransferase